jgi:hypothetical protein
MVSSNLDQSSDCRIFRRNERRLSVAKRMPSVGVASKLPLRLIWQAMVAASVARHGEGMSSLSRADKGPAVRGCYVARRCGVGIGARRAVTLVPDNPWKALSERLIRPDFNRFLQIVRTNIERPPELMSRICRGDAPVVRGFLHRHRRVSAFVPSAGRTPFRRSIRRTDLAFACSFVCRGPGAPAVSACRCRRAMPRPAACRAGRRLQSRRPWRPYLRQRAAIRTAC